MLKDSLFSYNDRLKLKKQILELTPSDWKNICQSILIPNQENITINRGGVFFCLTKICDDSILKIENYIKHRKQNEHKLLTKIK